MSPDVGKHGWIISVRKGTCGGFGDHVRGDLITRRGFQDKVGGRSEERITRDRAEQCEDGPGVRIRIPELQHGAKE
jgi:hypothetical protein